MRIAVIGGGLQGCGVALELANRGLRVDLFERGPRLLQGASRHSEGKIHLGYVYAADDTMRTARLMAAGAAAFLPTLDRWLGADSVHLAFSTPFRYAIHRDSLRPIEELEARYRLIANLVRSAFREHPSTPHSQAAHLRRLEAGDSGSYTHSIVGAYETGEIAVDTDTLADAVEQVVLDRAEIRTWCGASIDKVDLRKRQLSFVLDGDRQRSRAYDHVVNCSWDGLPAIDATAGVFSSRPWNHRVKYFVRVPAVDSLAQLASTTFVLGQFGDVVNFGRHGSYLSWYPAGRTAFTTGLRAPAWETEPEPEQAEVILEGVRCGLSTVMRGLAELSRHALPGASVRGGAILAHGDSDLDDVSTQLHQRHSIGPTSLAGYHSVNTGKLTMAPYFAMRVADLIRPTR